MVRHLSSSEPLEIIDRIFAAPRPAALLESLRGVGYSPEAAIADIVDNSIAAGARAVWIDMHWDGRLSRVTILDNGSGMDASTLTEAMRLGANNGAGPRLASDLGRFGLGLKTASFSQGRCLTVASKRDGVISVRRWDLDFIENVARDWELLPDPRKGAESLLGELGPLDSGTLVIWEALDRLVGDRNADDHKAQEAFLETIDRVASHLSMVFHRFFDRSGAPLAIYVNSRDAGQQLVAWDPFLADHPATMRRPLEHLGAGPGSIDVQAFVLPHKDRLTVTQFERAGSYEGWTALQGFYVYRNRRLLVPGSWLGLASGGRAWTKEEAFKLARIRVDLTNEADFEWDIDIRKSRAHPPEKIRPRLRAIGADAKELARGVFVHRGTFGRRQASQSLFNMWSSRSAQGRMSYSINRAHPIVASALDASGSRRDAIEHMLHVIEQTVPLQRIWIEASDDQAIVPEPFEGVAVSDMTPIVHALWKYLRETLGLSGELALARILETEPFNRLPEKIQEITRDFG